MARLGLGLIGLLVGLLGGFLDLGGARILLLTLLCQSALLTSLSLNTSDALAMLRVEAARVDRALDVVPKPEAPIVIDFAADGTMRLSQQLDGETIRARRKKLTSDGLGKEACC